MLLLGGVHEVKTPNFRKGPIFRKSFAVCRSVFSHWIVAFVPVRTDRIMGSCSNWTTAWWASRFYTPLLCPELVWGIP